MIECCLKATTAKARLPVAYWTVITEEKED